MAACDAYVSLHRSEGTGLTITDAMALGKPVIATSWSGNMGFVDVSNCSFSGSRSLRYNAYELIRELI
jgi:glycosyltransferase involved in cell wall biosynthesis